MQNALNLQTRISEALENELGKIYDELGIQVGDISPEQHLQWEDLMGNMAKLFGILIEQNSAGGL